MNPRDIQAYLASFINHETRLKDVPRSAFKTGRVRRLLQELGNPQDDFNIIHVAGSKGKGSTCAMIAHILTEAGYLTGLYTSPHLQSVHERIRVLAKDIRRYPSGLQSGSGLFPDMITGEELAETLTEMHPVIEGYQRELPAEPLSFFEVYTVAALCYFRRRKVEWVVLETGLGGRLDATNAVGSRLAVITPISLEHTDLLGTSLAQIAREKAGIIKNSSQQVIVARQEQEAGDAISEHCAELGISPVWTESSAVFERVEQKPSGQQFDLITKNAHYHQLKLPLLGKHQRDNAAAAVCACETIVDFRDGIGQEAVRRGLGGVFWPGRFEIVPGKPSVVLDGAHNPAAVNELARTMREIFGGTKIILVLGISNDKDHGQIVEAFRKVTDNIIYAKADHPRAWEFPGSAGVAQALEEAYARSAGQAVILIAGSIFLVAQARGLVLARQLGGGSGGEPYVSNRK